jgi:hypothetical protein
MVSLITNNQVEVHDAADDDWLDDIIVVAFINLFCNHL